MRLLTKGPCPAVLTAKSADWTAEILAILEVGGTPTDAQKGRYNRPEIKAAVKAETHDKCAYCESKVTHVDNGDIEHIVPKSKVPARAFEWENLTLACRICNQNKGDFHDSGDDHSGLVDPYRHPPEDHFFFHRELVTPRPDSVRGLLTEEEIKLSRAPLLERRKERMDFIDGLIRGFCDADPAIKPILKRDIYKRCCEADREFCAISRRYVDDVFNRIGA